MKQLKIGGEKTVNTVNSKKFREFIIFANNVTRHICDVNNLPLGHDLPLSVNDRVISPFHEILFSRNLAYAKFHKNKTLEKYSEFTVKPTATCFPFCSTKSDISQYPIALVTRKCYFVACEHQKPRHACAYAKPDQCLYYFLTV